MERELEKDIEYRTHLKHEVTNSCYVFTGLVVVLVATSVVVIVVAIGAIAFIVNGNNNLCPMNKIN